MNQCAFFAVFVSTSAKNLSLNRAPKIPNMVRSKILQNKHIHVPHELLLTQLHEVLSEEGSSSVVHPDTEKHKFLMVTQICKTSREKYFVSDAMEQIGFKPKDFEKAKAKKVWPTTVIVKNTPYISRLLWLCKHLIFVKPVTFPDGFPTINDIGKTVLNRFTGEVRIIETVEDFTPDLKNDDSFKINRKHLNKQLYRKYWLCDLNSEYFPTKNTYRYDHDIPGTVLVIDKDEDEK